MADERDTYFRRCHKCRWHKVMTVDQKQVHDDRVIWMCNECLFEIAHTAHIDDFKPATEFA